MTYELYSTESVNAGVVRILQEEVAGALQQLAFKENSSTTRIHECRKHLKKARSVIRLIRTGVATDLRKEMMRSLRNAGRTLSPFREMDAHLECLTAVRKGVREQPMKRTLHTVQQYISREDIPQQEALQDAIAKAVNFIEAARGRVKNCNLDGVTLPVIANGIAVSYRDSRRIYNNLMQQPEPVLLHEWRKRVKDLRYQTAIITNAWPAILRTQEAELHILTNHLGLVHDIALLVKLLEKGMWSGISARTRAKALVCASQRYQQEQAAAFQLGSRLFSEKAGCFRKRFSRYLQIWKTEK